MHVRTWQAAAMDALDAAIARADEVVAPLLLAAARAHIEHALADGAVPAEPRDEREADVVVVVQQMLLDVSAIVDATMARAGRHFVAGGLHDMVLAAYLTEARTRLRVAGERLWGDPSLTLPDRSDVGATHVASRLSPLSPLSRLSPAADGRAERGVRVALDAAGRTAGVDARLAALAADYQDAVVRSPHLDAVTTELVRLRCARQHDCRICRSLRATAAVDAGADESLLAKIDRYEASDLAERHKVALRLTDACIWRPAAIDAALAAQAHALLTDEELAELLVDVTKWSVQKVHVALGTDGTQRVALDVRGLAQLAFTEQGRPLIS